MKRMLEKLLAALLCCALLMSGMIVALGDELEVEEPVIVEETADESAPEVIGVEAEEAYEAPVDDTPNLETEEGEADAEALAEEAVELEPEAEEAAEPEGEDEGEVLTDHEELEVAESEAEAATEVPEEVEVSMAEALGEPELAEAEGDVVEYGEADFGSTLWAALINNGFDLDDNGYLSQEELDKIGSIDIEGTGCVYDEEEEEYVERTYDSLAGIDRLRNLSSLSINSLEFEEGNHLDLTNNTQLTSLTIEETGGMTTLDVSACAALQDVCCTSNGNLTQINLGEKPELVDLDCSDNRINSLDLSGAPKLCFLCCNCNQLTTLDVSRNTMLESIEAAENGYTTEGEDEDGCYYEETVPTLESLTLGSLAKLSSIDVSNNALSSLDVTNCTALTQLNCRFNRLKGLDVSNCPRLLELRCEGNSFTSPLDISACKTLGICYADKYNTYGYDDDEIEFEYNYYELEGNVDEGKDIRLVLSFDIGVDLITGQEDTAAAVALTKANFPDAVLLNRVKTYDLNGDKKLSEGELLQIKSLIFEIVTKLTNLKGIELLPYLENLGIYYAPKLTRVDVSKNAALVSLAVSEAALTSIDVTKNQKLQSLDVSNNKLKKLDVSQNPELDSLSCERNALTQLDLSHNVKLKYLNCSYNALTALDLSPLPELEALVAESTKITELDLSVVPKLDRLFLSGTKLGSLDLSSLPNLEELECGRCGLTTLDISNNNNLWMLIASDNKLTKLDLTKNQKLRDLTLFGNSVSRLDLDTCPMLMNAVKGRIVAERAGLAFENYYEVDDEYTSYNCLRVNPATVLVSGGTIIKGAVLKKATGTRKTILVGDRLYPALYGAKVKSVKTSKKAVAIVAKKGEGLVIVAKKPGKAVITVTLTNKKTRKLTVTVVNPTVPKTIKMSQTRVTRIAGQAASVTLKANLTWYADPLKRTRNTKVTWTSSNTKIASVEGGVVKLLRPGQVTITAKDAGGKKATCVVTIKRNKIDNINKKPDAKRIAKVSGFSEGFLKSVEIVNPNRVVVEWYAMNGNKRVYKNTQVLDTLVGWKQNGVKKQLAEKSCDGLVVNIPAKSSKVVKLTYSLSEPIQYYTNLAKLKPSQMYGIWDDAGE